MSAEPELLTIPEAALVAGVDVRDVNRLIDERILPAELYTNEDSRRVWAGGCVFIRFYYGAAWSLTAQERKYVIDALCREPKAKAALRHIEVWRNKRARWKVEHGFLAVNFARFIEATLADHDRLARARAAVTEDPQILGGTPVIKGTRVPVYDVAASTAAGIPRSRIKDSYPSLSDELIDLAVLYARVTPPRGRPPRTRSASAPSKSPKVAAVGHEVPDRRMPVKEGTGDRRLARGQKLVESLRGRGDFKTTTDEILALMRGPSADQG